MKNITPEMRNIILDDIAMRVKSFRIKKKLSQQQLAQVSGVSVGNIRRIENKQGDTTFHTIIKLSRGLDVSLSEFFKDNPLEFFF